MPNIIYTAIFGLVFSVVITGCSGGEDSSKGASGETGTVGVSSLVRVIEEPTGTHCAGGGQKIITGSDVNKNTVLDEEEIASTQYICNPNNGEDGTQALVSTSTESSGLNCVNGGTRIDVGLDDNNNTVLDVDEIDTTNYICNGTNGNDAATGRSTLIEIAAINKGDVNCSNGGIMYTSGLDDNNNSILENIEIDQTEYICNGVDGSNGTDGHSALITTEVITVGDLTCPTGGYIYRTGLDVNNNLTLEPLEVNLTATRYICNGKDGSNGGTKLLVSTALLPIGDANCTNGGFIFSSGYDDNNDSLLDPLEIDQTQYICNGEDGENTLVTTEVLLVGSAECSAGGFIYRSGIDDDSNGTLESVEVDFTETVCNGVRIINQAPIGSDLSLNVNEDTVLTSTLMATDNEGDNITFVLSKNGAYGVASLSTSGLLNYEPRADFSGTDTVKYYLSDPLNQSPVYTITINVTNMNDAPAPVLKAFAVNVDGMYSGNIASIDIDGDTLTYAITQTTANGLLNYNTGTQGFTYTPSASYSGADSFTYTVSDGTLTVTQVVDINVSTDNFKPVATSTSFTIDEDMVLNAQLTGTDMENAPLTYTLLTPTKLGDVSVASNGSFVYTPYTNSIADDGFVYRVFDGQDYSASQRVSISFIPHNDAPVAMLEHFDVDVNGSYTGYLDAIDPEGDPISRLNVTMPLHGSLVVNANDTFVYTPTANYSGIDSFSYQLSDGALTSIANTVTINVHDRAYYVKVVSSSKSYSAALKSDGSLWWWGGDESRSVVARALSDVNLTFVDLTFYGWGKLALLDNNHTLWSCDNYCETPTKIRSGITALADSPVGSYSYAITDDKTLVTSNSRYQTVFDNNSSGWSQVNTLSSHTLALKDDGTLWAWGDNSYGQLGDGSKTARSIPIPVTTDSDWVAVWTTENESFARKSDGTLYRWGADVLLPAYEAQLGAQMRGISNTYYIDTNASVRYLSNNELVIPWLGFKVNRILNYRNSDFAITNNGKLLTRGRNNNYRLGDGSNNNKDTPVEIAIWIDVFLGNGYKFLLNENRTLWSFGSNDHGQLGLDDTTDRAVAEKINDILYKSVVTSRISKHNAALTIDNKLYLWGENTYGQVGNGTDFDQLTPYLLDNNSYSQVAVGANFSVALRSDGTLWTWGNNASGQLGKGDYNSTLVPVQVGSEKQWKEIAVGSTHIIALKADGSLWGWGNNSSNQVAETNTSKNIPTLITDEATITEIGASENLSWYINDFGKKVYINTDFFPINSFIDGHFSYEINAFPCGWQTSSYGTDALDFAQGRLTVANSNATGCQRSIEIVGGNNSYWASADDNTLTYATPHTIIIDLEMERNVSRIEVVSYSSQTYRISISTDMDSWINVAHAIKDDSGLQPYDIGTHSIRYIAIEVGETFIGNIGNIARIREVHAFE